MEDFHFRFCEQHLEKKGSGNYKDSVQKQASEHHGQTRKETERGVVCVGWWWRSERKACQEAEDGEGGNGRDK